MAIDTESKRSSSSSIMPFAIFGPAGDGGISAGDRAHGVGFYSGVTYSEAVAVILFGEFTVLEGKKNTDKWFPVKLVDSTDLKTAETGKAYGDITCKYAYEAATEFSEYSLSSGSNIIVVLFAFEPVLLIIVSSRFF